MVVCHTEGTDKYGGLPHSGYGQVWWSATVRVGTSMVVCHSDSMDTYGSLPH